jgi:hypothetical protein
LIINKGMGGKFNRNRFTRSPTLSALSFFIQFLFGINLHPLIHTRSKHGQMIPYFTGAFSVLGLRSAEFVCFFHFRHLQGICEDESGSLPSFV